MKEMDKGSKKKLKPQNIPDVDSYLGYWLRFVSNQVTSAFEERLAAREVTVAEWIALRYLLSRQACSLTELAKFMGMTKGALSKLTDHLEKRGLIYRHRDAKDKRLFSIELTSAGQDLVPELTQIAEENDEFFFGHLSRQNQKTIKNILKQIADRREIKQKPLT